MKKLGALLIVGTLLLTGCGKKVTCSGDVKSSTGNYKQEVTATLKNDKVSKVTGKMTFEDESTAKTMCSWIELANNMETDESKKVNYKCSGKTITINNYDKLAEDEDGSNKVIGLTKDEFIKLIKENADEDTEITCK